MTPLEDFLYPTLGKFNVPKSSAIGTKNNVVSLKYDSIRINNKWIHI